MEAYFRLRPRHQRFVDAIVAGKNGADAVREITPKNKSAPLRPDQIAYKLRQDPDIAQAIEERQAEAIEASGVRLQRVLEELTKVAYFDPRRLFTGAGRILPTSEWPDDVAAAIAGIDVEALYEGSGKDRERIGDVLKYRAWPKIEALKLLLQHLGGLTEKHEHSGPGGGPIKQQITNPDKELAAAVDDNDAARAYAALMTQS